MTGRLVVLPSRSEVLLRSAGYGAGCGAAIGAAGAVVTACLADPSALGLLILAPIAVAAGAISGLMCGFAGGIGQIILRRHLAGRRGAIRVAAGSGAGLLPAIWLVAGIIGPDRFWLPGLVALTVLVVALAAVLGPCAFYGRPPRQRQRPSSPHQAAARREIVG